MIVRENAHFEGARELNGKEALNLIVSNRDLGDLGFSFKKAVKQFFTPVMQLHRAIIKKLPKPVQRVFSTKFFLKAAPFIAVAAQVLNLVVPGLGILVSLAINAAATAIALGEARKAKAKLKKVTAAENAADAAAIAKANADANASLDAAYTHAQTYFVTTYQETPDKWKALSVEDKTRFFNLVMYDQHSAIMTQLGVTKAAFTAMTTAQQHDTLARAAETLPAAPGPYVPDTTSVVVPGAPPTMAPFELPSDNTPLVIAGVLGVLGLGFVLFQVSKRR